MKSLFRLVRRPLLAPIRDARFSPSILSRLPSSITKWTECQEKMFEAIFSSPKSILLESFTGSGKTLAYLLPLLNNPVLDPILVIVPTRELAAQVGHVASSFTDSCIELYGGVRIEKKIEARVVVATPGSLINNLHFLPSAISSIIVDEVDRLFDLGFIGQVEHVFRRIGSSQKPRLVFVSATVPSDVALICKRVLGNDYIYIKTGCSSAPRLTHYIFTYEPIAFQANFEQIITTKMMSEKRSLVVFPTTRSLMYFYSILKDRVRDLSLPISVHALHGRMLHEKRKQVTSMFARDEMDEGSQKILFSTDVAARGLDFPSLGTVCQVGLSGVDDPVSQFIHRAGRTARAGNPGTNILMLGEGLDRNSKYVEEIRREQPDLVEKRIENLGRVTGFESTPYQRHLSTKCLESLLSWYIERRSVLGIKSDSGGPLDKKAQIIKGVTDMVRSTGLAQPRLSEKLARQLGIDQLPGLLVSKHR
jgi:ATP-dependent RNA helicase RhlE